MSLTSNVFTGSIIEELGKINDELLKLDTEVTNHKKQLVEYKLEVAKLENQYKVEVAFDTTLTNERQRDAALLSLKRQSEPLMNYTSRLIPELEEKLSNCENTRSFKYRQYQILMAYINANGESNLETFILS